MVALATGGVVTKGDRKKGQRGPIRAFIRAQLSGKIKDEDSGAMNAEKSMSSANVNGNGQAKRTDERPSRGLGLLSTAKKTIKQVRWCL